MSVNIEKRTIKAMIKIYCKKHHGFSELCPDCSKLHEYSSLRIERCVFGKNKPACNKCKVHCYSSEKRENIKEIMRYSGRKMLLKHPYLTFLHFVK